MAAVPDVHSTSDGSPVAMPEPRAAKAAERSSRNTETFTAGLATSATASGVEREPGAIIAERNPMRTHSSTSVAQNDA